MRPARGVALQRRGVKDGETPVRGSRVEELLGSVERERGDRVGVATGAFGGVGERVVGDVREAVARGLLHVLRHLITQMMMRPVVRASGGVPRRRSRRVRVERAVGTHSVAVRLRGVRVAPVALRGLPVALHDVASPWFDLPEGLSPHLDWSGDTSPGKRTTPSHLAGTRRISRPTPSGLAMRQPI